MTLTVRENFHPEITAVDPNNLSQEYVDLRYQLIVALEGISSDPYYDSEGLLSIGIGFNLESAGVLRFVLIELGVQDTPAARQPYSDIITAGGSIATVQAALDAQLGSHFSLTNAQINSIFNELAIDTENELLDNYNTSVSELPESYERAVLFSLAYNEAYTGALIGPGLQAALDNGDRAEAWFEIRYNSNRLGRNFIQNGVIEEGDTGLAKRRFLEAEVFGLYADENNVSLDEAQAVYRMLQLHREYIYLYENAYGTLDGLYGKRGDMVAAANTDPTITAIATVSTVTESFAPAAAPLIAWVNTQLPDGMTPLVAGDFLATNLYLDLGRASATIPVDGAVALDPKHAATLDATLFKTGAEHDERNLLMGEGGADTLIGDRGADVLLGSDGADTLMGGAGADTLFGGLTALGQDDKLRDVLQGGDGPDTYYIGLNDMIQDGGQGVLYFLDGSEVSNKIYTVSATAPDTYQNGALRLTLLAEGGVIVFDQATGVNFRIEDFSTGDFGITLNPTAVLPEDLHLVAGDPEDNDLTGTAAGDEIQGYAGNDAIDGDAGDDLVLAGLGDDEVQGGGGNDLLQLGEGNDNGIGGEGDDSLDGGVGDDYLFGGMGNDLIHGGVGRDVLMSTAGNDLFLGGDGDDFISGGDGADVLQGDNDHDFLAGGAGIDTLLGGVGEDVLFGDGCYAALDRDWQVTVTDATPTAPGGTTVGFNSSVAGTSTSSDDQGDLLDGGAGDDILLGGGGNDQLYGGDGQDDMEGEGGYDRLEGGAGDDALFGDSSADPAIAGNDMLLGGDGNDYLIGGLGTDELEGGAGVDRIWGDLAPTSDAGERDTIDGGAGNDVIFAGGGNDTASGGLGEDQISGNAGEDVIDGGADDDTLHGDAGKDTLVGGTGDDTLMGDDGDDTIDGGEGMDGIVGGLGNDVIHAGASDDINVQGGAGDDEIHGVDGDDTLYGEAGGDRLFGGTGDDTLFGMTGEDWAFGGTGSDRLVGGENKDTLHGEGGDDHLWGDAGNDIMDGGDGMDILQGADDNDVLAGGASIDLLYGEAGDDSLHGGTGNDTLAGGEGADTYRFEVGDGVDTVIDPDATDRLQFGAGLDATTLFLNREGNHLAFTNSLDANDKLVVQNWFLDPANRPDSLAFADGAVWTQATLENHLNTAPLTAADSVAVIEDIATPIAATTLLANDSDAEGDALSLIGVGNAVHGAVSLDGNGDVVFTSAPDFNGEASFTYTVRDARNGVAVAQTVTVNVAPSNDAPVAVEDMMTITMSGDGALIASNQTTISTTDAVDWYVPPRMARLSNNNFVAVWQGYPLDSRRADIALQLFDTQGDPLGTQQQMHIEDSIGTHGGFYPAVAALGNGGFVVMWHTPDMISTLYRDEILAQIFDAGGIPVGGNFRVNKNTYYEQVFPDVVSLNDGGFFAIWTSYAIEDKYVIAGQRFNATGDKIGHEINFGIPATDYNKTYDIAAFHDDGFVIATQTGSIYLFDSDGNQTGSNTFSDVQLDLYSSYISQVSVTALEDNHIVVTWLDNDVYARVFNDDGRSIGGTIDVSADTSLLDSVRTTALDSGGFVVTWFDTDLFSNNHLNARMFTAMGDPIGQQLLIDSDADTHGVSQAVVGMDDGGFLTVWTANTPPTISDIVQSKEYNLVDATNGLTFKVDVLSNDTDIDSGDGPENFTLVSASLRGEGAEVGITDNRVSFSTTADLVSLSEGETLTFTVDYTLADLGGLTSSSTLQVVIPGSNDPPVLVSTIPDQLIFENQAFAFVVPEGVFTDLDHGDSIVLSARGADGSPLPAWLQFDPLTRTFSGTPDIYAVTENTIKLKATDQRHAAVEDTFVITVADTDGVLGTVGNDVIEVTDANGVSVVVYAREGDDTINISGGRDITVYCGAGDDTININLDPATGGITEPGFVIRLIGGTGNTIFHISGATAGTIYVDDPSQPGDEHVLIFDQSTDFIDPVLSLGSLALTAPGSGLAVHLVNFDPEDAINGPRDIDEFRFADGSVLSHAQLVARGFDIQGTDGDDNLTGTNLADRIDGLGGSDAIGAGAGDDLLNGGAGDDRYNYQRGDGVDRIVDTDGFDTILFSADITPENLRITRRGGDLQLELRDHDEATGDRLILADWFTGTAARLEDFVFTTGNLNSAEIEARIHVNHSPVLAYPLADMTLPMDQLLWYTVPSRTFSDQNAGDSLSYQATRADGTSLPAWLEFDAVSRTFHGTPAFDDYGAYGVRLTATDEDGLSASDEITFTVTVPTGTWIGTARNETPNNYAGYYYSGLSNGIYLGMAGDDLLAPPPRAPLRLAGGPGDDMLYSNIGNDILSGGDGNDYMVSGSPSDLNGQDMLRGGTGNDYMAGGPGNDTYQFYPGIGVDRILDWSGSDTITLDGMAHEDLWFWQEGDDLQVGVLNSPDRIMIEDWFSNPGRRIETMQTLDDGFVLLENQVQQLVNAMAVFDVPASGNLVIPQENIDAVQSVIATSWHGN